MVNDVRSNRLRMAVAAGATLIAVGGLATGCGKGNQGPSTSTTPITTTTTTPTSAAPSPTEKGINPTGGNLFTPGVTATPAPNVPPGQHPGLNGNP